MKRIIVAASILALFLGACSPDPTSESGLKVVAVESFIADMAQNVAGDRLKIDTLIPLGVDPHSFELTPADVSKIADADVLIVNGTGFEEWLQETMQNSGSKALVIEASLGLDVRTPTELELDEHEGEEHEGEDHEEEGQEGHHHAEGDPHFWLDPVNAQIYVENIRQGLTQVDPKGEQVYAANAEAYTGKLEELDRWISDQTSQIPQDKRLLVTNHESFGYFADRYEFKVIGAIIPSVTTGATPTAQELAGLTDHIKQYGAPAIFLETGSNPQLANQLAEELHIKVVEDLYTHSLSENGGEAPDYISMMRWNTMKIVEALQ